MSATVDFTTVTNSIAALSISNVTIKDTHEIPDTIGLDNHILAPVPNGFVTDLEITRDELTGQKLRVSYTLNYRYYHIKIAGVLFATYQALLNAAALIVLAFASDATLTGAMDNTFPTISGVGPVPDPAGQMYHGFNVSLRIMQFLEV